MTISPDTTQPRNPENHAGVDASRPRPPIGAGPKHQTAHPASAAKQNRSRAKTEPSNPERNTAGS